MINSISGEEPHCSWGGWENFLKNCQIRDTVDGVVYYGKTNCNYILFPDGTLLENYSSSGIKVMRVVAQLGCDAVLAAIKVGVTDLRVILATGVKLHDAQHELRHKHPIAFPPY